MASIIRIKRSSVSGNPATLAAGELAYSALPDNGSNGGDRLYIGIGTETAGNAANHVIIGGKYFTDMLDHSPGTLVANSAIIVDANKKIDSLLVDNLELNGNTLSTTNTNGNLTLSPNGSGYVQITGTNALVIPSGTTVQQGPAISGAIRYNTTTSQFEGYASSTWQSLGGVRSVDGQTYITAESAPGASDNTLRFYTNGAVQMSLDTDSLDVSSSVSTVNINATTASTSATTGALVVDGGVGIAGDLNVAGSVTQSGGLGISGGDLYSTAATFNLLNQDASTSVSNDGPTSVNAFLNATSISIGAATGTLTIHNASTVVSGNLTIGGNVVNSSSATAITLDGSNVAVQGTLTVDSNTIKSSSATAITLDGANVEVQGSLDVGTQLNVGGTALISGDVTIGAPASRSALTVYGTSVSVTGSDNTQIGVTAGTAGTKTLTIVASNSVGDANLDINVDDAATLDASVISLDATDSSNFSITANSASTKTLSFDAVNEGVGEAVIAVGSSLTDKVNLTTNSTGQITLESGEVQVDAANLDVNANTVDIVASGVNNSIALTSLSTTINTDTFTLRGTEGAGDTTTLNVVGQFNIDNIRMDGNSITTTDGSNTLYLDPAPAGIQGLVVIEGDLQVNGTTTTINSTQITIDDPIFVLGGDTAAAIDDNLDRGIEFQWHDGTNPKLGFFGYDDSAAEFTFIPDANDNAGVVTGTAGNVRFGKAALINTTQSTTTSSGALTVAGGVGVGGQLNVAGAVNKFTATTVSTSINSGAVVVAGGVGVAGSIFVGDALVGAGADISILDGFNIDGGTY